MKLSDDDDGDDDDAAVDEVIVHHQATCMQVTMGFGYELVAS